MKFTPTLTHKDSTIIFAEFLPYCEDFEANLAYAIHTATHSGKPKRIYTLMSSVS